jgi:hypothetical protein
VHIIKGKTRAQVSRELTIDESAVTADMYDAVVLHGETLLTMSEDEWDEVTVLFSFFNFSLHLLQSMQMCVYVCTAN